MGVTRKSNAVSAINSISHEGDINLMKLLLNMLLLNMYISVYMYSVKLFLKEQ